MGLNTTALNVKYPKSIAYSMEIYLQHVKCLLK